MEHFDQVLPDLLNARDAETLINAAQSYKKDTNLDFDLIVAQPGENELYVLKENQFSRSSVAYIGDKEGFEAYQKAYFLSEPQTSPQEDRANISISLQPAPQME